MKHRRSIFVLAATALAALLVGLTPVVARADEANTGIAIIHSNDVHCAGLNTGAKAIGYAGIAQAAINAQTTFGANNVTLVDAGDAIQGQPIGTISKGADLVDIMNTAAYDLAVPGNHEFDYGIPQLQTLAKSAEYPYVSCNVVNTETNTPLFDAYEMKTYMVDGNEVDVAYVGITTPTTLTSEAPTIFQDASGKTIWSFYGEDNGQALYSQVQESVDAAKAAGAEYVIAIAHLGKDASSTVPACYTSTAVVANTTGIDGVIDGHTHEIYNVTLPNKDGEMVPVAQCGTQFQAYGQMTITPDEDPGPEDVKSSVVVAADLSAPVDQDATVAQAVAAKQAAVDDELGQTVGTSQVGLCLFSANDEGKPWWWVARMRETNLGDYVADAYRAYLDADVAFINGGGVRGNTQDWIAELSDGTFGKAAGSMTYADFISINPYANSLQLVEVSGQDILDALEYSVRNLTPAMDDETESTGSFLQVSGLTFTANIAIQSPVIENADGGFQSVNPLFTRRVSDVKLSTGEALDPNETYQLATIPLLLTGDYTMFEDCTYLRADAGLDSDALVSYLQDELDGTIGSMYSNPAGQGRINLVEGEATVYRLYNRWSGEHLFTIDINEAQSLKGYGWTFEGPVFTEYSDTDNPDDPWAEDSEREAVYRLYNRYNGDHFYTASLDEAAALMAPDPNGWVSDGVAFWAPKTSSVPVYRLWNPYMTAAGGAGSHLWTTSKAEVDTLTPTGWRFEGTSWHAL